MTAALALLLFTLSADAGATPPAAATGPATADSPQATAALGKAPKIAPLPTVKIVKPQRFKLPSGLAVWALPRRVAPIVVLSVVVPGGAARDPEGKAGLASATADMLDEGAGARSALDLARDLEALGAQLSASASRDGARLTLKVPTTGLATALDIFADVLSAPQFAEAEWKRVKGDRLTNLLQRREEPGSVAQVLSSRLVYGDGHPYAPPVDGYARSVEALAVTDLQAFHAAHYRPDLATLVAAGDFDVASLRTELARALGRWKAPAEKAAPRPRAAPVQSGAPAQRLVLVDRADAPQTVVRLLGPGLPRNAPARAPLTLASTILGGSFTSRLNSNLREDKGYTYGAGGSFSYLRDAGSFGAGADVFTKVTDLSVKELQKELDRLRAEPLTADELQKARAIVLMNLAESLSTSMGLASVFSEAVLMGEPPEAPERFIAALRQATPATVQKAVAQHLDPKTLTLLVVGDRKKIETPLRALGYPEPDVRDPDGERTSAPPAK